jgi:hypothetical protein
MIADLAVSENHVALSTLGAKLPFMVLDANPVHPTD